MKRKIKRPKGPALSLLVAGSLLMGFLPVAQASGVVVGSGPSTHYTVHTEMIPGSCSYRWFGGEPLPDSSCTPGATNPAVTQSNLYSTICKKGYTSSIRPPVSVTYVEKRLSAKAYGNSASLRDQEYDHLISLELGGSPNDTRNLWVEPQAQGVVKSSVSNDKDQIENELNALVCQHKVTLKAAQIAIASNWVTALAKVKG